MGRERRRLFGGEDMASMRGKEKREGCPKGANRE